MIRNIAASVAICMLTAGCGSSDSAGFVEPSSNVGAPAAPAANFFVQGPPVNGRVTVQSLSGETLAEGEALAGLATLPLPEGSDAPVLVTFVAEDEAHLDAGGGPASFYAEVPSLEADDMVGIDPVSSLIALHHRAQPDLTFEQAADDVLEHLDLPLDTDPEHLFEDTDFEGEIFYAEANAAGGVDELLQSLVEEIPESETSQERFLKRDILEFSIVDVIAKKLADSVLEYVDGQAKSRVFGWLEGVIGIGGPGIGDVLSSLEGLRRDIDRLSGQIAEQANTQAYNERDLVLVKERSDADVDTETLTGWASPNNLTPPTEAQISAKMDQMLNRYNSTLTTAARLELPDVGAGGVVKPGLAGLFLNAAAPRFYGAPNKEKATFHLRRSLDFQQMVLNLVVEAQHYARPSMLLDAERTVDNYFANAKLQRQQYPLPFDEENLLLDRGTNLLWSRRPLVVNDYRTIDGLLRGYTLGNSPAGSWRVPSVDEMTSIVFGTGGTGIDQHTEIGMLRAGFLPINGASTIGDWRIPGPFNWKVLTMPITRLNYKGKLIGMVAKLIHVSNFRSSDELIEDHGRIIGPVVFYVVRSAPKVDSISVTETARSPYSVSYRATARLSDGSQRDVSDLVRWAITKSDGTPVTHDVARISNVSGSDGLLTLRVSNTPALTVRAAYNSVEGTTTAPSLTFAAPAVTALLISPLRHRVPADGYTASGNTFQMAYRVRTVRANGALADANSEVTWTSSDPSVTVSSGLVTATRPAQTKIVDITATKDGVSQTAKLILER